jgi:acetyltransferase-like isoleucine patch superfamily enzyme
MAWRRSLWINAIRAKRYLKGAAFGRYWRLRGVTITDRVAIEGLAPSLYTAGSITIGSRALFRGTYAASRISAQPGSILKIGNRVFVNNGCVIDSSVLVEVGDRCLLGDGCQIRDSNYHEIDEGTGVKRAPIKIGRNVWLGANAMVLPGVVIGDHSVIGAFSVVTKSIPARSLASGNPALVIREITASDDYIRP